MPNPPTFDVTAAHKFFAADCYNQAWSYIDKATRTPADDASMLQTAMASLWHWSQREDATPTNFSIGYWQVSRVFALLGQADNARRYGEMSLQSAQDGAEIVFVGFGYEALARAEMVAGNTEKMKEYLAQAWSCAEKVGDKDDKDQLVKDLETIG